MTPARHLSSLGGSYPLPTSASNEVLPYAGFPQASSEIFHIALLRHAPASNYAMSLIVYSNNAKVQSLSRVGVLSGVVSVVPLCALIYPSLVQGRLEVTIQAFSVMLFMQ